MLESTDPKSIAAVVLLSIAIVVLAVRIVLDKGEI